MLHSFGVQEVKVQADGMQRMRLEQGGEGAGLELDEAAERRAALINILSNVAAFGGIVLVLRTGTYV